jgi:hypothetical protein
MVVEEFSKGLLRFCNVKHVSLCLEILFLAEASFVLDLTRFVLEKLAFVLENCSESFIHYSLKESFADNLVQKGERRRSV